MGWRLRDTLAGEAMEADFWHQRWAAGQTGFHQDVVNPYLQRHWPELGVSVGSTVFVPLCGKSLDMAWLHAQGLQVVGVELSALAIQQFLDTQGLVAEQQATPRCAEWQAAGYRLLVGDFFKLTAEDLGPVDAVYDRASLIALPPAMRRAYVDHLRGLLPRGIPLLLVTVEYDQAAMQGPPFAVHEDEVRALCADFSVVRVARHDVLAENENFMRRGLAQLHEAIYRLRVP
jgi:thiopurine S-methyltransferase